MENASWFYYNKIIITGFPLTSLIAIKSAPALSKCNRELSEYVLSFPQHPSLQSYLSQWRVFNAVCCFLSLASVAGGEDRHFSRSWAPCSSKDHMSISLRKLQTGTCDLQQCPLCRRGLSQWPSRKWAINRSTFSITNITSFTPFIKLSARLFEVHERKTSLGSLHLCPSCSRACISTHKFDEEHGNMDLRLNLHSVFTHNSVLWDMKNSYYWTVLPKIKRFYITIPSFPILTILNVVAKCCILQTHWRMLWYSFEKAPPCGKKENANSFWLILSIVVKLVSIDSWIMRTWIPIVDQTSCTPFRFSF